MKKLNYLVTGFMFCATLSMPAHAATIAIIDSGTDLNHSQLSQKQWNNPIDIDDAVDNDDNGYIDDIHGWNFAEGNNKLFDKRLLGKFSTDVYKFFEVQTRLLKGEGTQADQDWMRQARSNAALLSELQTFGNFVHGTHVAGIAARASDLAKIMVLKIIPTKTPKPMGSSVTSLAELGEAGRILGGGTSQVIIEAGLKALASQQAALLSPIGKYVSDQKAQVANCSFGTSTAAAKMLLGPILKLVLRHEPTQNELDYYSRYFVSEVVKNAKALVEPAKKTFFVMAAGNDGEDNDVNPTSPANYKAPNTITVAATMGYNKLASFSNYGEKMVEVAAPGVGIESSIPGEQLLTVSGTSQAAPYVAGVVGALLDINPNLNHADLKKIVMGTVDVKSFLKGKVTSSGIVNLSRATFASKLALSTGLENAISSARIQVSDVNVPSFMEPQGEGFVIPLPSLIQF